MDIYYKPSAVKQLKKLPATEKKKIIRKIELLSADPKSGKPLKGELEGFYSLRAWPYRIIYGLEGNNLIISSITHRQSAYK